MVSTVATHQPLPALAFTGVSCPASITAFNGTIWPRSSPPPLLAVWMLAYVSPPRIVASCGSV